MSNQKAISSNAIENGNYKNQQSQGYILNAFAVGMLPDECIGQVYLGVRRISETQFNEAKQSDLASPAIGNRAIAEALDLPCRPQRVTLQTGVKNYLAQYRGPRFNGSGLPPGGRFEFYEIEVLDIDAINAVVEYREADD